MEEYGGCFVEEEEDFVYVYTNYTDWQLRRNPIIYHTAVEATEAIDNGFIQPTEAEPSGIVGRVPKAVKDTKTGTVYYSKAEAGRAVAAEYGLDPTSIFVWYEVLKLDPKRFVLE